MIPQTIGREYDVGKIASVQCVKNDTLKDISIKTHCFLMLIIREGTAYFQVGDMAFEAVGPCFVCFDEREQPKLVRKRGLKCDTIYFHPQFLNVNMSFQLVHSGSYDQVAMSHNLFLLKPFTDEKRYVFPLFEEYIDNLNRLFSNLEGELKEQRDWYWSCRSRSYFMEIILMLERVYGIIGQDDSGTLINKIKNPHLKNAVIFIESHYQDNIRLESIAKAASMNHSTLTQLFKDELSMTPVEYLWQYRIIVAKKHLEFTSLPVKEISMRCGFKTMQHFSRKFEAYTHNTPTAFRGLAVAGRKAVLQGKGVKSDFACRIEDEVNKVRTHEEWKVENMSLFLINQEKFEEGEEKGREEKTRATIINMLKESMTMEVICRVAECDESYVKKIQEELDVRK